MLDTIPIIQCACMSAYYMYVSGVYCLQTVQCEFCDIYIAYCARCNIALCNIIVGLLPTADSKTVEFCIEYA